MAFNCVSIIAFYLLKVNLQDVKVSYCVNPKDLRVSPVSNEAIVAILKAVDHLSTVSRFHVDKVKAQKTHHT